MNFLFVEDTEELKTTDREFGGQPLSNHEHVFTVKNRRQKCLYDVAIEIKNTLKREDNIIFINQFLACSDNGFEWLQSNAGIALIKFLRMMDVRQHIVLITPYNETQLIKDNPANLIVSSKGVTLKPYLHEIKDWTEAQLKDEFRETFDKNQNLKPYLFVEFQLPEDERHNWANWWGIMQLVDVHRHIFPRETNFRSGNPYPAKISELLGQLKSRQALFLYNQRFSFGKSLTRQIIRFYERQLKAWEYQIETLSFRIHGFGKKEPSSADWKDYVGYLDKVIEDYPTFSQWELEKLPSLKELYDARLTAKEQIEKGKHIIDELKTRFASLGGYIANYGSRSIESSKDDFKDIVVALRSISTSSGKPRILHIDDQAQQGWSEIFQLMFYGSKQKPDTFDVLEDLDKEIQELKKVVLKKIERFKPDLILLDLRLKNEGGVQTKVEELSGAKVLEGIKQEYPGMPVVITTASNKVWSYRRLQRLGSDAYWSKEGLDVAGNLNDQQREDLSTGNYLELIESVSKLCGKKYTLLRTYGEFKKNAENTAFWWEEGKWKYPSDSVTSKDGKALRKVKQIGDRETVQNILEEVYYLLFSYLQLSVMGNGYYKEKEEWFYPSLIIQQLGKCIEVIHDFESLANVGVDPTIQVLNMRCDAGGVSLYKRRGSSSHFNKAQSLRYEDVDKFIMDLIVYLSSEPLSNHNLLIRENG